MAPKMVAKIPKLVVLPFHFERFLLIEEWISSTVVSAYYRKIVPNV